jgi:translation initiation factor 2 subunit 2
MERMTIAAADFEVRGKKTILKNFKSIAKSLRREPEHFSKYLSKKLATRSTICGGTLELQGIFSRDDISREIESYAKHFVYCRECFRRSGKLCPDTHLVKDGDTLSLECEACGTEYRLE